MFDVYLLFSCSVSSRNALSLVEKSKYSDDSFKTLFSEFLVRGWKKSKEFFSAFPSQVSDFNVAAWKIICKTNYVKTEEAWGKYQLSFALSRFQLTLTKQREWKCLWKCSERSNHMCDEKFPRCENVAKDNNIELKASTSLELFFASIINRATRECTHMHDSQTY